MDTSKKIVYAGDRDVSVWVLEFMIGQGIKPLALAVSGEGKATHAQELTKLCSYLDESYILKGDQFRRGEGMDLLNQIKPDYLISVHFPYILPKSVLEIPKHGVLNLHPAYLPYNRGWHTPTWAIWDKTPYGATLHFMSEGLDDGDIIHQKQMDIYPNDTANTLYKRVKKLELEVFKEAWPSLLSTCYTRRQQNTGEGTIHRKSDIKSIQFIDLDKEIKTGDLIRRLRALTTNNIKEGAYFRIDGKSYRMQLQITEGRDGGE